MGLHHHRQHQPSSTETTSSTEAETTEAETTEQPSSSTSSNTESSKTTILETSIQELNAESTTSVIIPLTESAVAAVANTDTSTLIEPQTQKLHQKLLH